MLFHLGFVEIISLPHKCVLRGVFLANHLASTDNLTSNNRVIEHTHTQANVNTKVALIGWRFGVAVTRWSRSTQLLYIKPG